MYIQAYHFIGVIVYVDVSHQAGKKCYFSDNAILSFFVVCIPAVLLADMGFSDYLVLIAGALSFSCALKLFLSGEKSRALSSDKKLML